MESPRGWTGGNGAYIQMTSALLIMYRLSNVIVLIIVLRSTFCCKLICLPKGPLDVTCVPAILLVKFYSIITATCTIVCNVYMCIYVYVTAKL